MIRSDSSQTLLRRNQRIKSLQNEIQTNRHSLAYVLGYCALHVKRAYFRFGRTNPKYAFYGKVGALHGGFSGHKHHGVCALLANHGSFADHKHQRGNGIT